MRCAPTTNCYGTAGWTAPTPIGNSSRTSPGSAALAASVAPLGLTWRSSAARNETSAAASTTSLCSISGLYENSRLLRRDRRRRPHRSERNIMGHRELLRVPALEIRQGLNRTLYSFAVDGKELPRFAAISRIHRDDNAQIHGYQRPEVLSHIAAIRRYLESEDPMIPNALVVAFDSRVRFEPELTNPGTGYACPGTLIIPLND